MEVIDAIKNRRSIRSYKQQEIPQSVINQLIDAARLAPSAGNAQSWAFVVAQKHETKGLLSDATYGQRSIQEASVVIVVCADEKRAYENYGPRGKALYCIQDTAAAVENILLTACSLGLGTCWIGAFREEEIRKVINCPQEMRPVALIPVGYPNESPSPRPRRPISEIMYKETF
jgi:nitroreductase